MSYHQNVNCSLKHVPGTLTVTMAGGEGSRFVAEAKQELNFCRRVIVTSRSSCWYCAGPGDEVRGSCDHSLQ